MPTPSNLSITGSASAKGDGELSSKRKVKLRKKERKNKNLDEEMQRLHADLFQAQLTRDETSKELTETLKKCREYENRVLTSERGLEVLQDLLELDINLVQEAAAAMSKEDFASVVRPLVEGAREEWRIRYTDAGAENHAKDTKQLRENFSDSVATLQDLRDELVQAHNDLKKEAERAEAAELKWKRVERESVEQNEAHQAVLEELVSNVTQQQELVLKQQQEIPRLQEEIDRLRGEHAAELRRLRLSHNRELRSYEADLSKLPMIEAENVQLAT
eukprot:g3209.t1